MSVHILIDYSDIRKGDLKAIEYPRPLSIHLFFHDKTTISVDDDRWLEGDGLDVEKLIAAGAQGNANAVPIAMAIKAGALAASTPASEIFIVSNNSALASAIEVSSAGFPIKVSRQIASLPIKANGALRLTRSVLDRRLAVMAGIAITFFVVVVCAFLSLLGTFAKSVDKTVFFDFGAYVLPGLGAVFAGIGLFLKRWEPVLYFISALCVICGLGCYMNSNHEFAAILPHDPNGLFIATTWCVAALTGVICSIGLLLLSRVTYGPRQQLSRAEKRLRFFYWMIGLVNVVACVPLIALSVQMRIDPDHWHDQGRLHGVYSWLASLL